MSRNPRLSQQARAIWDTLSFPFRLAYLSSQAADIMLLMPVEGVQVSDVADTWGAPRQGGRKHEGQDIFTPRNTPIYSAVDGFVTRISDCMLGDNSVISLLF